MLNAKSVSKEALEVIVGAIPAGVVIVERASGKIIYVNEKASQLYGVNARELEGEHAKNLVKRLTLKGEVYPPDQLPVSKALRTGQEANDELIIERPDGSHIIVEACAKPIKDKTGQVVAAVGIFDDITERKKVKEALKASEEKANALIKYAPTGIYEIEYGFPPKLKSVNDAMCKVLRYSREELLNMNPFEILYDESKLLFKQRITQLLAGEKIDNNVEFNIKTRDGKIIYALLEVEFLYKDGKPASALVVAHDITDRKKAEEALEASERKFKTLAENAPDPIMRFDPNLRITYLNPADLTVIGATLGEVLGKTNEELGMTEELCKLWNDMFARAKTTKQTQEVEFDFNSTTGIRTFCLRVVPEFAEDGSLVSYIGISRDITERKEAEEQLRASQEVLGQINLELEQRVRERTKELTAERQRLFEVLESIPAMVCLLTPDYHVAFANRSFREKFGEANGRHCHDFCYGNKEPCTFCETYKVLETGKPHHWQVKALDGSIIDVHDFPFTDIDGTKMILEIDTDITDQVKMQKQLKDSERLAAIGATAGMVGHDIRNPLQAIVSDLYIAKQELKDATESSNITNALQSLDAIETNIFYIDKIVSDLQDFARQLKPSVQDTNIRLLIAEVLANSKAPSNIIIQCKVDRDSERISGDSDFLKRIVSNLVLNAFQAMPEGGTLSIRTQRSEETDGIVLTVEDTGVGISEEVKSKLFTPMFTTKSKGQGFGLAVIKRMVEALGGSISYESEVGKGTKFIVRLPPPKELNGKLAYR